MMRSILLRVLVLMAVVAAGGFVIPTLAQIPKDQQPPLGYVTGPERVVIVDLEAFERVKTVLGPAEVQFLSSSPKFGPNGLIYIADSDSGNLAVLDPQARKFTDFISLGSEPNDFEILEKWALVNDLSGDRVQLVNLLRKETVGEAAVNGPAANEIALSPDASRAYVTTFDFSTPVPHKNSHPLVVFDITRQGGRLRLSPAETIPLARSMEGVEAEVPYMVSSVAVSSNGKRVYVLAVNDFEEEPMVFSIDAESLQVADTFPIELGRRARAPFVNILALSPDDRTIGISAFQNGIALLDLNTRETKLLKPEGRRLTDPRVTGVTFGPQSQVAYSTGFVAQGQIGFVAAFDVQSGEQQGLISLRRQPLLFMAIPGGTTF